MKDIFPFKVIRFYCIYKSDKKVRGGNLHKITRQALIALSGDIDLKDIFSKSSNTTSNNMNITYIANTYS